MSDRLYVTIHRKGVNGVQVGSRRPTQVTAEEVRKVIRRATRNTKDKLLGAVVRKLGEDALYLFDRLKVDADGRPKAFSVWEFYKTYVNDPQRLFEDAGLIDEVNRLYWHGKPDLPSWRGRAEWLRTVLWPKLSDEERLQLQVASDFITSHQQDETHHRYHVMSVLRALVWTLVEREQKWERVYCDSERART